MHKVPNNYRRNRETTSKFTALKKISNKKGTDTVPFGVIFRKIVKQTKTVLSRFAL